MNTALWRLDYLSQTKHTICYIYIYIYIYICTPAASARPRCPHGSTVAPPHASGGAGIRTAPAPVHVDAQHSHHICTRIHTYTFAQCAACCKHSYDMHPPPHMTHTHIHVCTVRCVHRASTHTHVHLPTRTHARTHAHTQTQRTHLRLWLRGCTVDFKHVITRACICEHTQPKHTPTPSTTVPTHSASSTHDHTLSPALLIPTCVCAAYTNSPGQKQCERI